MAVTRCQHCKPVRCLSRNQCPLPLEKVVACLTEITKIALFYQYLPLQIHSFYCRLIGYTHGWRMFWLSIVFRVISGVCAALNNVCTASITLKSKSYSTVQLFVSIFFYLGIQGYFFNKENLYVYFYQLV